MIRLQSLQRIGGLTPYWGFDSLCSDLPVIRAAPVSISGSHTHEAPHRLGTAGLWDSRRRNRVDVPDVRYAQSADTSIAYQVFGKGPHDLVLTSVFVSRLDLQWRIPSFSDFA